MHHAHMTNRGQAWKPWSAESRSFPELQGTPAVCWHIKAMKQMNILSFILVVVEKQTGQELPRVRSPCPVLSHVLRKVPWTQFSAWGNLSQVTPSDTLLFASSRHASLLAPSLARSPCPYFPVPLYSLHPTQLAAGASQCGCPHAAAASYAPSSL